VRTVVPTVEQWQQRPQRGTNVADHRDIYRAAPPDLLSADVHLRDTRRLALRVELPVGKIRSEHQQGVAVQHCIVARGEADQPGHADVVGVVPLDVLLAAHRVHHRRLEALAELEQLGVRALAP
jgi:hypothetical protein